MWNLGRTCTYTVWPFLFTFQNYSCQRFLYFITLSNDQLLGFWILFCLCSNLLASVLLTVSFLPLDLGVTPSKPQHLINLVPFFWTNANTKSSKFSSYYHFHCPMYSDMKIFTLLFGSKYFCHYNFSCDSRM